MFAHGLLLVSPRTLLGEDFLMLSACPNAWLKLTRQRRSCHQEVFLLTSHDRGACASVLRHALDMHSTTARTKSCMSSCFVFEQTETISQLKEDLIRAQSQLHTAHVAAKVGHPCFLATPVNICSKVCSNVCRPTLFRHSITCLLLPT